LVVKKSLEIITGSSGCISYPTIGMEVFSVNILRKIPSPAEGSTTKEGITG
jgi:hypothetical protein